MKNILISDKETEALQRIFKEAKGLTEAHKSVSIEELMNNIQKSSQLERIHVGMYTDLVKDFIRNIGILEQLINTSEEEFKKDVTDDGKISLNKIEHTLLASMLLDSLDED